MVRYASGHTGDGDSTAPEKRSKFQRWLKDYGVQKLANAMTNRGQPVSAGAVYQWGRRLHEPRGPKLRLMVELSRGALTPQDIVDHFARP
jgi:hypothetical protein